MIKRNLVFILLVSAILFLNATGCSGSSAPPVTPAITEGSSASNNQGEGERTLWGIWDIHFDPVSMELVVGPSRSAEAHFDITDMVLPPACDDCFGIHVNSFDPVTRVLDADVTLHNSFPIAGRDVRGIFFETGTGHALVNPDDWTSLWDLPGGLSFNPFKAFAKEEPNRTFLPDAEHTEKYLVYIPVPPQYYAITFAVDASWPGNCKDPYEIAEFHQLGELVDTPGASAGIEVVVHDWQGDVSKVTLVAPEITGESFTQLELVGEALWGLELFNNEGAGEGEYVVRIIADSANSPGMPLYDFAVVLISSAIGPTVTGIEPDHGFAGTGIPELTVTGEDFVGPGAQVILKRSGEPDIAAEDVVVVNPNTITCGLVIPMLAGLGTYNVQVINGGGGSGVGFDLFEVEGMVPNVTAIDPGSAFPNQELIGAEIFGGFFQGPGAQVKLIHDSYPEIEAGNVVVDSENHITCDIPLPFDAPLGFYDVEVINPTGMSGIGEDLLMIHAPTPVVASIDPATGGWGDTLTGVSIQGDGFQGPPGAQVKLKMAGKPDIAATNVEVVDQTHILCDIFIPYPTFTGLYDVDVMNGYFASGVGIDLFTVEEPVFAPTDVTPPWLNFSPRAVAAYGDYVYIASTPNGLHVFDVSETASPHWIYRDANYDSCEDVEVSGSYLYMADYDSGLVIFDLSDPSSPTYAGGVASLGGARSVTVSGDYAYVAWAGGLEIVDINPPGSAASVKNVLTYDAPSQVAVDNGYAYVAVAGWGLEIIDVDPPASASLVNTIYSAALNYYGIAAHNGYVYASNSSQLMVFDVDPPGSASIIHTVSGVNAAGMALGSSNYLYVADYLVGMSVVDISTPATANVVDVAPFSGSAKDVAVLGGYAYLGDEDAGLVIYDISTPNDAVFAQLIYTPGDVQSIAIFENTVFTANDLAGTMALDITVPEAAAVIGRIETYGTREIAINNGIAYVGDIFPYQLDIVDIDPLGGASILNTVSAGGFPAHIAYSDGYVYMPYYYGNGCDIFDVDPAGSASLVKNVSLAKTGYGVAADGNYAYVSNSDDGLKIIDISVPSTAYVLNTIPTSTAAVGIYLDGGHAYVGGYKELYIVDIDPPGSANIVKTVTATDSLGRLDLMGGYLFTVGLYGALEIFDVDPINSAHSEYVLPDLYGGIDVKVQGNYVYIGELSGGLKILKLM